MIPIRVKNLGDLAERHYNSIEEYILRKRTKYDLAAINQWIEQCFGKEYGLKKLVLANPLELEQTRNIFDAKPLEIVEAIKDLKGLYDTFASTNSGLRLKDKQYSAWELVDNLGITVCPYCNRNFIFNVRKRRTSELDHFYPKDKYPFFALSFYNLVPSCKTCNHIKGNQESVIINPYDERFEFNRDAKFKLQINKATFYYDSKGFDIDLNIESNNQVGKKRMENSKNLFKLKELYDHHKDVVLSQIQTQIVYNDSYIDELYKQYEGTLFKNREDVIGLIFSNFVTDAELNNRPLSKLTKDIAEDLGILDG